jgi:hypothetical protein
MVTGERSVGTSLRPRAPNILNLGKATKEERKTMRTANSKWASGILLSLLFAPPAAADLFSYTGGVQTFTAPVDGVYDITADGASGGNTHNTSGGFGAEIGGAFTLTAGEILSIYVGGSGADVGGDGAGGGGGTFVVDSGKNPLIVAGGGGGAGVHGNGGGGLTNAPNSHGGSGFNDGGSGAGFTTNGGDGDGDGGSDFTGGLSGGEGFSGGGDGGFGGGGGGGGFGGGGGGGYSGGAGGNVGAREGGAGGGSFDAGLDQLLTGGENSGDGQVEIELVQAPVPEPASCVLFGTLLVGVCVGLRRSRPGSSKKSVNSNPNYL